MHTGPQSRIALVSIAEQEPWRVMWGAGLRIRNGHRPGVGCQIELWIAPQVDGTPVLAPHELRAYQYVEFQELVVNSARGLAHRDEHSIRLGP